ncbi:NAD(P)-dependent dehydrogenase, short-chain alcohol dehydrogenase family [Pseudomonas asturiensis]|uniref:NAD(P)-dependent dehydrogenase, short-chain alcohol dehydrogenase family n=1 Tax=Pseudomonas asturiensis TaxID=1190415 RepID=A0A1M7PUE7_9PSED|nr:SDR family NAD(P)-dependent oxidoreductase [Pseudomonas asturiensis]SHN21155.1 NAD(P)-dependent dehydrogenase, short-chain alcohol dehydrogenase family [Pseudomonas asturiensis]
MKDSMQGKVVIVTGAGAIAEGWSNGRAAAVLYARHGATVLAVDRDAVSAGRTRDIIREEGGVCEVFTGDVTSSADMRQMVAAAQDYFGSLDTLHNNVGIAEIGGPVEATEESWNRLVAVNQTSLFLTCKYALPVMEKKKSGSIVNIASIAADRWLGFPYVGYSATKAAMIGFTQNIAVQYAPHGIRANCVSPGFMNTPMVSSSLTAAYGGETEAMLDKRHAQCPMGFMGDAWDVANAALFLASDSARYVTGINLVVDGGLTLRCA